MIEEFLKHIEFERRYSVLTVRNYRRDIESFDAWLRNKRDNNDISHCTTDDIREWIIHRTDHDKISPAAMNRELSSLRSFFSFLRQRGRINEDLFARIGSLKKPKHLPSIIPETRIPQLLDSTAERVASNNFEQIRDALIILMFYKCGIRLAELIGINTDDIAADQETLKIRGKGDKERIVPLVGSVRTVLNNYIDAVRGQNICKFGEKALFLTVDGCRISRTKVYRVIRSALTDVGIKGKKSPHVLRHTFATQLMNAGADMRDIQELMGHSSLSSTQVYTHNSIRQLQKAYAEAHPRRLKN